MSKPAKPLRQKAYGSIPHLPLSRLGPGDWSLNEGQAEIATTRARDKRDRIIVTEKLDGSNVSVARINGELLALGRAGYLASDSPYDHIRAFGLWVGQNRERFTDLPEGTWITGEWMAYACGTRYAVKDEPFIAFDVQQIHKSGRVRLSHDAAREIMTECFVPAAKVISDGPPISIERVLDILGEHGFHGALEQVEGAVWRVERDGEFDFIAKFVRPEKIDGKYFPEISGAGAVWNSPNLSTPVERN